MLCEVRQRQKNNKFIITYSYIGMQSITEVNGIRRGEVIQAFSTEYGNVNSYKHGEHTSNHKNIKVTSVMICNSIFEKN